METKTTGDHEGENFHRNGQYSSTEAPHPTRAEGTYYLTELAFKEAARDFLHSSGGQQEEGERGVLPGATHNESPLHRHVGSPPTIATSHSEDAPPTLQMSMGTYIPTSVAAVYTHMPGTRRTRIQWSPRQAE